MKPRHAALRTWLPRCIVVLVVATLYTLSQYPTVSASDRSAMAGHFRFQRLPLPEPGPAYPRRTVRRVNPQLKHVAGWMSGVGAGVALADLDGDGLPNDVCLIDTRTDTVMVAPVPGTTARYALVVLDPAPLPFDRDSVAPTVCLPGDFNEDGQMDLLVSYWGRSPIIFFRSGDRYVPRELIDPPQVWNNGAIAAADLDGDGHADLVVGNYFRDGDEILNERSTRPCVLQTSMSQAYNGGPTHILRWASASAAPDPRVKYEEARDALEPEVAGGWTLAIGARDLDGDLLPELYLAHDFGPDRLLHNRSTPGHIRFARLEGRRGFADIHSKVLGHDSFKGMGVDFGDINGDGVTDFFVSNLTSMALQENHFAFLGTGDLSRMKDGVAPFVDRSEPLGMAHSGWAWDVKIADFDNDGQPELVQACGFHSGKTTRWPEIEELAMENDGLMAHPGSWPRLEADDDLSGHETMPFWVRHGDRFVDLAAEVGLGQKGVSRGIAVADVDGDGDLDFAVANQWDTSYFVRNDCPACGSYLGLHLRLPLRSGVATTVHPGHPRQGEASRPAIGAQAIITLPGGRRMSDEVDGGNGHSGKRSPDLHFGLSRLPAGTPLPVTLRWRDPSGRVHEEHVQLTPGWHTIELGWN